MPACCRSHKGLIMKTIKDRDFVQNAQKRQTKRRIRKTEKFLIEKLNKNGPSNFN